MVSAAGRRWQAEDMETGADGEGFIMSEITIPKSIRDEYTSVNDTKCACGTAAWVVERQRLVQTPWGHSDWLEARCRACGATRGFAFPLPSFGRQAGQDVTPRKVPDEGSTTAESVRPAAPEADSKRDAERRAWAELIHRKLAGRGRKRDFG